MADVCAKKNDMLHWRRLWLNVHEHPSSFTLMGPTCILGRPLAT